MSEVVIVGAARTPLGCFQGALASVPAPQLGSTAIAAALERAGLKPDQVSETIMGNVLSAGLGQAPARQAALGAGIPNTSPAMTVNKVCGSAMMAIILGARAIRLGESDVVVAGGMENMSRAPYLLAGAREGLRMGDGKTIDSMIHDGLWDPYSDRHMGLCAEHCASEREISREDQDAYAIESFRRARIAQSEGKSAAEIAPVKIVTKRGDITVDQDERPAQGDFEKIPKLRPVFDKQGTITAANASSISDGAAAVVLMSADKVRQMGCKPLGRLAAWGIHSHDPLWFTTAPVDAISIAMKKAGWGIDEVDLFEINEAFAVVPLAAQRALGIPPEKLNVRGGAIALGHPLGASGARIVVTLLAALADRDLRRGVAGLCIGGGEATALCVEMMN